MDLRYNIQIRSAAHAFEGKCFVVVAGSLISPEMREFLGDTPEKRRLLGELRRRAGSASPEELRALVESLLASLPAGPSDA